MKKIILSVIVLTSFIDLAFAGHNEGSRKKCHWYSRKYHAEAHVGTPLLSISRNADRGCESAKADVSLKSNNCTVASEAHSIANSSGCSGWVWTVCSYWAGMPSPLYQDLFPGGTDDNEGFSAGQNAKCIPVFGVNTIDIRNIDVMLSSATTDPRMNTYTLGIWVPEDDSVAGNEDTLYHSSKALIEGVVTLQNGDLHVDGGLFTPADFQAVTMNGVVTVRYIGGPKHFDVPDNLNIDDLAVNNMGDVKPDETPKFRNVAAEHNGVIKGEIAVNTYPNPVVGLINISISLPESRNVDIKLYDMQGKLILTEKDQSLHAGDNMVKLNVANLPAGEYFIVTTGTDVKAVNRVILK